MRAAEAARAPLSAARLAEPRGRVPRVARARELIRCPILGLHQLAFAAREFVVLVLELGAESAQQTRGGEAIELPPDPFQLPQHGELLLRRPQKAIPEPGRAVPGPNGPFPRGVAEPSIAGAPGADGEQSTSGGSAAALSRRCEGPPTTPGWGAFVALIRARRVDAQVDGVLVDLGLGRLRFRRGSVER